MHQFTEIRCCHVAAIRKCYRRQRNAIMHKNVSVSLPPVVWLHECNWAYALGENKTAAAVSAERSHGLRGLEIVRSAQGLQGRCSKKDQLPRYSSFPLGGWARAERATDGTVCAIEILNRFFVAAGRGFAIRRCGSDESNKRNGQHLN